MWKCIVQNEADPAFYLKVEEINTRPSRLSYRVSVTNYVKLWSKELDDDDIIQIMMESNLNIEASARQVFLNEGLRMLNNPKQLEKVKLIESEKGCLNIEMLCLGDIAMQMNFTLSVCSAEQFFDTVTRPLLLIIDDQKKSETELRRLMEGIRGFLSKIPEDLLMRYEKQKIEEYHDEMHMKKHNAMEELFGSVDPDERINPRRILYGRPLPALPYDMPLPIKEEADSTGAGPSSTQIPIKTEHNDANESTSRPSNSISELNVGKSLSNKFNQPVAFDLNKTNLSYKQEARELKQDNPDSTEQENNSMNNGIQIPIRQHSKEAEPIQSRNTTPKKRRKNLNY